MKRSMTAIWIAVMLFAGCGVAGTALAQPSGGAGTVSGSGAEDFESLVNQDVASGYYSQAQGDQLKSDFEAAQNRIDASMAKAGTDINRAGSLYASGNQGVIYQLQGLVSQNGQLTAGGTPQQVQEQATALYNAVYLQTQMAQTAVDIVHPLVQDYLNEVDQLMAKRNDLIKSNPNVPSAIKHNVQREAAAVHDFTDQGVEKTFSTMKFQIQTVQGKLESDRTEIIGKLETVIDKMVAQYGPDPSKWPKAAPTPPAAKPAPTQPTPPPQQVTLSQVPPAPTPSGKAPQAGVVPSNAPDPSLSVSRNGNTKANSKGNGAGNGNQNGGNSTGTGQANNGSGPPSQKSAQNGAPSVAQNTPPPNTPKPKPPPPKPPPPKPDIFAQLKPQKAPPPLPIVAPPPKNPSAFPPSNQPAYTYNAPPAPPGGQGGNVTDEPPPGDNGPVFAPSQEQTEEMPPPVPYDLPKPPDAESSPDNSGPPAPSSSPPVVPHKGVNPNSQVNAGNDPSFDAHRNDPNYDPNQDNGSSGDSATGNAGVGDAAAAGAAQAGAGDVASQAAAAGAAAGAAMAGDYSATGDVAVPPQAPPWQGPVYTPPAVKAPSGIDILNNLPKGNMHIVEGDQVEGTPMPNVTLPPPDPMLSVEYGDTLTVAALQPIYAGYQVTPGQGGSSVIIVPSTEIATPSSVMVVPSLQVDVPSAVMTSLDLYPALCGR